MMPATYPPAFAVVPEIEIAFALVLAEVMTKSAASIPYTHSKPWLLELPLLIEIVPTPESILKVFCVVIPGYGEALDV